MRSPKSTPDLRKIIYECLAYLIMFHPEHVANNLTHPLTGQLVKIVACAKLIFRDLVLVFEKKTSDVIDAVS